jgi:hypothetical protein
MTGCTLYNDDREKLINDNNLREGGVDWRELKFAEMCKGVQENYPVI